jgi:hypothetical protein
MKRAITVAALGIAALALASVRTSYFAEGRGVLVSETNHQAHFGVAATKTEHAGQTAIRGHVVLETGNTTNGRRVRINVAHMNVVENTANMAGPAVLVVYEKGVPHEVHGVGEANAVSRRHPGEQGDPDTLAVHFSRTGGPSFSFAGRVGMGDITVGKNVSY